MTQEFAGKSHPEHATPVQGSGPKSLAERLQWMADRLPGFREELEIVDQSKFHARQVDQLALSKPLDAEHQVKTISLTYPDFCLLIGLVAERAGSDLDSTGEWKSLYVRLGGDL